MSNAIQSPVIVNDRPRAAGSAHLEIETAAGAAVEFFRRAIGVRVPRSRFLPVKSTSDLLAIQSNLYEIRHGSLIASPLRDLASPPVIKLGDLFVDLDAYAQRIPFIPDLIWLDHLTISGSVTLGRDVVLRGTVIIVAAEGERIDIPDGAVLENKVLSGSLRIVEH